MKVFIKTSRDGDNEVNDDPNNVENSREFGLTMAIKDIKSQDDRGVGILEMTLLFQKREKLLLTQPFSRGHANKKTTVWSFPRGDGVMEDPGGSDWL